VAVGLRKEKTSASASRARFVAARDHPSERHRNEERHRGKPGKDLGKTGHVTSSVI